MADVFDETSTPTGDDENTGLKRTLSLPLVVLYGLGVTIGAGIYVLLGATVERSGIHAPVSFFAASAVMIFSAASFAELSGRFPVSAGEAAYVRAGFRSETLSFLVGILVVFSGVVSSAAIIVGSVGYVQEFIDIPDKVLIVALILLMGVIVAWGIMESIIFASLFTVVEIGALLAVIGIGISNNPDLIYEIPRVFPEFNNPSAWTAIAGASLLAFFAFIGFEDIVNLAEEMKQPRKTMTWAIFLTLAIGTVVYFLVSTVAVLSVPLDGLAASRAPLSYVFTQISDLPPHLITAIAIVATLNGVVIQIIMASRVIYGLGKQKSLPAFFAKVHPRTRTPLIATGTVIFLVIVLAMLFPVDYLAEMTSRIVLVVFALVNMALILLKFRAQPAPEGIFEVWSWVPVCGVVTCIALLATDFLD